MVRNVSVEKYFFYVCVCVCVNNGGMCVFFFYALVQKYLTVKHLELSNNKDPLDENWVKYESF